MLLAAHAAGDPSAFPALFARHRDRLWSVALRTMGNPSDAEDALQDALLAIHRSAATFRGESAVTTWMHRIVVNACLDRLRRAAARPASSLTPDEDESEIPLPDPVDMADNATLRMHLDEALQRIPEEQRIAVVLVDVLGYSIDDAAAAIGCPPGTVKSRSARGRARLAVELATWRNREQAAGVASPETPPSDAPTGARPDQGPGPRGTHDQTEGHS